MIVELEGLQKVYDGKQRVVAVDGIDLNVHEGELYGSARSERCGKDHDHQHLHHTRASDGGQGAYCRDRRGCRTVDGATMYWSRAAVQHARPRLHHLRKYLLSLFVLRLLAHRGQATDSISCSHSFT